ncbi:MAG TPA: cytochrome c [Gemmatimonadaceae bacterium]|nr:cytochrome c [Gemmatimonadaceae bacterium]
MKRVIQPVVPNPFVASLLRVSSARDLLFLAAFLAACTTNDSAGDARSAAAPPPPASYALGQPVDSARLRLIDIDVDPSGASLPPGSGNAARGLVVYAAKCALCHGGKGEGLPAARGIPAAPQLVGRDPREGFPFGRDPKLVKTVGNYWPHATTIYDYVHRAMPWTAPGTLTPDETYAVVAWLLAENEIIPRDAEMNAKTLPAVKMPAAGRFVPDDRSGRTVK